ncbi:MAG: ribosome-binding factor A [bacterium]
MDEQKLHRLSDLVRDEVNEAIKKTIDWPLGLLATVTSVNVGEDLGFAVVRVSVLPIERGEEAMAMLEDNRYDIQRLVAGRITTFRAPKLKFVLDTKPERLAQFEQQLDQALYGQKRV